MELNKISILSSKLLQKALKKDITWTVALFDEEEYQISFPNQTLGIQKGIDFAGEEYFRLKIYNMAGSLIDDFGGVNKTDEDNLRNLFHIARREVLGLDDAIDDIISNLE